MKDKKNVIFRGYTWEGPEGKLGAAGTISFIGLLIGVIIQVYVKCMNINSVIKL